MLRSRKATKSNANSHAINRAKSNNPSGSKQKWYYSAPLIIFALISILASLGAFIYMMSSPKSPPIDILFIFTRKNNIHTMDDTLPKCEAMCIDQTNGKIIFVGTNRAELRRKCRDIPHSTLTILDASKYVILPGFIDSHAHIMMQAAMQFDPTNIDVSQAESFKGMMKMIQAYITKNNVTKGSWIKCLGYDDNHWYDWYQRDEISRFDLDKYVKEYKLVLFRIDIHAVLLNTMALDEIKHSFPANLNVDGGDIRRTKDGKISGLLIDNAQKFVTKYVHPYYGEANDVNKYEKYRKMVLNVIKECNKYGLTAVHDMDERKDIIENVYKYLVDKDMDNFNLRLSVYVHGSNFDDGNDGGFETLPPSAYNKYFMYGDRLSVRGVKFFLDGALGSWGAKLIDPYCDKPETNGIWRYKSIDAYYEDVKLWHNAGWQLSTHAIGDRANRLALDMYEKLIKEYGIQNVADLRLRIEHAQIVEPIHDLPRFAEMFIFANMQPSHAISDLEFADDRLKCKEGKDRILGAYAWKSMIENGVNMTFGSDFPAVGKMNPFLGIYAATIRQTVKGYPENGWMPKERLSILEAVKAHTIKAAYASYQEEFIGSIAPGKFADFVLIDKNIFQFDGKKRADEHDIDSSHDPLNILKTNVVATFFNGKIVYHNDSFAL